MKTGGGAFGAVYRARQVALDRWVAVKVIDERNRARRRALLKEARTQARLRLDCIPQVYDAFEWRSRVWIVMQWVKGAGLDRLLSKPLRDAHRLWLAEGVINAVARLHREGFAHRDLKPANILVSPDEGVLLVDFGFTKHVADGEQSMAGMVKGTPAYMAPELWRGDAVDYMRADVYALGKILRRILAEGDAEKLLSRMTHEDPAKRPASATAVHAEWDSLVARELRIPWWDSIAGPLSREIAANTCCQGARALMRARRTDEAYWLLVECLEENPDHAEALALMGRFSELTRRRRVRARLIWAGATTAAAAVALLLAFWAGFTKGSSDAVVESSGPRTPRMLKSLSLSSLRADYAAFQEDSLVGRALTGRLAIIEPPAAGRLYIDGSPCDRKSAEGAGLALPFGEYAVSWRRGQTIVWRERIRLLPFQKRAIHIDPADEDS
jgi:hypothetical protein